MAQADREVLPVCLAEYEFRYNHHDEHVLTILFDQLYRPIIEHRRLPIENPYSPKLLDPKSDTIVAWSFP
jgi:hypothetical protein